MKLTLVLTLGASLALAQSSLPSCIETCIDNNLSSSWCDGDETGAALDQCNCQSYANAPMIPCMREKCSDADQGAFAARVPELCRDRLFPGVEVADGGDDSSETTAANAPSQTGEDTPEATESGASGDDDNGVLGREIPGLLAAGGIVAALLL